MLKLSLHNDDMKTVTVRHAGEGDLWVKPVKSNLDGDGEFLLKHGDLLSLVGLASSAKEDDE